LATADGGRVELLELSGTGLIYYDDISLIQNSQIGEWKNWAWSDDGLYLYHLGTNYWELNVCTTAFNISTATPKGIAYNYETDLTGSTWTTMGYSSTIIAPIQAFIGPDDGGLFVAFDSSTTPGHEDEELCRLPLLKDPLYAELPVLTEFGLSNPFIGLYMRPWDKDTNERKRVIAYRILHYASAATFAGTSNVGVDWIDTEKITDLGVTTAAFTSDRNINIAGNTARIYRGGMTRQRIHKITFSGERTQILKGLEIDYEVQSG
jgi:hypothetical protein